MNSKTDEIISIEDVGIKETYDFVIPKTHCFFANDILIHNSGEIENAADVAILLHWEWQISKEEKDKNIMELRIAKNRHGKTGWCKLFWKPEFYLFNNLGENKDEQISYL